MFYSYVKGGGGYIYIYSVCSYVRKTFPEKFSRNSWRGLPMGRKSRVAKKQVRSRYFNWVTCSAFWIWVYVNILPIPKNVLIDIFKNKGYQNQDLKTKPKPTSHDFLLTSGSLALAPSGPAERNLSNEAQPVCFLLLFLRLEAPTSHPAS